MRSEPWRPRRFSDILTMSWPLGRVFGVRVSVHVLTALVPLFLWLSNPYRLGVSGALVFALIFTLMLYLVVFGHELGHIAMARRYGIRSDDVTLSPMGGVAHLQAAGPTPKADVLISAAGPLTHVPWIALFWILGELLPWDFLLVGRVPWGLVVTDLGLRMNVGLMIFNLLPIFPLDGGRILEGVLAMRMAKARATIISCRVGQVGGGVLMLGGVLRMGEGGPWGAILLMIGLNCIMICTRMITMARMGAIESYRPRQPWESSGDAWKSGGSIFADEPQKASGRSRRKEERDRKAHNRALQEKEEEAKELDRILEKIHAEGMPSLTAKERKFLKRTSDRRRD